MSERIDEITALYNREVKKSKRKGATSYELTFNGDIVRDLIEEARQLEKDKLIYAKALSFAVKTLHRVYTPDEVEYMFNKTRSEFVYDEPFRAVNLIAEEDINNMFMAEAVKRVELQYKKTK